LKKNFPKRLGRDYRENTREEIEEEIHIAEKHDRRKELKMDLIRHQIKGRGSKGG
jgi:hypothetical protein